MKKILCAIIILILALGVVACAPPDTETTEPDSPPVTTPEPEATAIEFNDAQLEARVRNNMNRPEGDITFAEAEAMTYLDLSSRDPWVTDEEKIKDISVLAKFSNLESLDLRWNDITDLTPLAELNNLELLLLDSNESITDFSPLAGLTNMKDLQFAGNDGVAIDDANIGFITDMTQIEVLRIDHAPGLSDIRVMANFPNLYKLDLQNCSIRDVTPLAGLDNLRELYLLGNPITDFSPLQGIYENLEDKDFEIISAEGIPEEPIAFSDEWLEAALRQAMDITDRDITTRDAYLMTSLDLSVAFNSPEPRITSIDELSFFVNLKSLSFDFHEVSDISPLAGLTKLEELSFSGNRVSDISALAGMKNLTGLKFFGNQVSDISVLSGKTGMRGLTIFGNHISDISPLAGMTDLDMLRMEDNQVSDISVLSGLTSLRILTLRDNPITDYSPIADIYPQLGEKDFELD